MNTKTIKSQQIPLIAGVLLMLAWGNVRGEMFEVSIPPAEGAKHLAASYRLWIPEGVDRVRAIIVHQHGCGRNGMTAPFDVHWQRLAFKWGCALLGSHYADDDCANWWEPDNGSEKAFLRAIEDFSKQSNRPELVSVPWVLWGHSGGAFWSTRMLDKHPEKIVAVFARSGAKGKLFNENLNVPILFVLGKREKDEFLWIWNMVHKGFDEYRSKGALAGFVIDPESSHDCRNSRLLAIPFFDACLEQRLNDGPGGALKETEREGAWLGNLEDLSIAPVSDYKGDILKASWLLDEATARRWQEYARTGWVTDDTSPEAPFGASACAMSHCAIEVTWEALADLHSGIKTFVYYRDDEKVGQYKGPEDYFTRGGYQYGNYGDEPSPEAIYKNPEKWERPRMKFTDTGLEPDTEYSYRISTVNWSGLESEKSAAVRARTPKLIIEN